MLPNNLSKMGTAKADTGGTEQFESRPGLAAAQSPNINQH